MGNIDPREVVIVVVVVGDQLFGVRLLPISVYFFSVW